MEKKVYKIRAMLREQVRLRISGNKRIVDNEKGALYEVIWFSNGDYELHCLKSCGIRATHSHIPFNPVTHETLLDTGWGDDKYDYNKEEM